MYSLLSVLLTYCVPLTNVFKLLGNWGKDDQIWDQKRVFFTMFNSFATFNSISHHPAKFQKIPYSGLYDYIIYNMYKILGQILTKLKFS